MAKARGERHPSKQSGSQLAWFIPTRVANNLFYLQKTGEVASMILLGSVG